MNYLKRDGVERVRFKLSRKMGAFAAVVVIITGIVYVGGASSDGAPSGAVSLINVFVDGYYNCQRSDADVIKPNAAVTHNNSDYSLLIPKNGSNPGVASLNLRAGDSFFKNSDVNSEKAVNYFNNGTLYLGMWIYSDGILDDFVSINGTKALFNADYTGEWQFTAIKIEEHFSQIQIKQSAGCDYYIDDMAIYSFPPDDNSVVFNGAVFYDYKGNACDSLSAGVASEIALNFNYSIDAAYLSEVRLIKNSDMSETAASLDVSETGKLKIKPSVSLEPLTEYTLKVYNIKNIYGGSLNVEENPIGEENPNGFEISFKTSGASVFTANLSETVTGTSVTDEFDIINGIDGAINITAVLKAVDSKGMAIGINTASKPVAAGSTARFSLSVNFTQNDEASGELFVFNSDTKMPPSLTAEKPYAAFAAAAGNVSYNKYGNNTLNIDGSFPPGRNVTAMLIYGKTFDLSKVLSVRAFVTEAGGAFSFSEIMNPSWKSGDYTVFLFGEGGAEEQVSVGGYKRNLYTSDAVPPEAAAVMDIYSEGLAGGLFLNSWNNTINGKSEKISAVSVSEKSHSGKVSLKVSGVYGVMGALESEKPAFITDNKAASEAFINHALYLGFWVYSDSPLYGYIEGIGSASEFNSAYTGKWQFVLLPVTYSFKQLVLKMPNISEFFIDDMKLYHIPPDNPDITASGITVYDDFGAVAAEAGVMSDITVNLNYSVKSSGINAKIINISSGEDFPVTAYAPAGTAAVKMIHNIPFSENTEYKLYLSGLTNTYGGVFEPYEVTFKTSEEAYKIENITENRGTGEITGVGMGYTFKNSHTSSVQFVSFMQAKKENATVGIGYRTGAAIAKGSSAVDLSAALSDTYQSDDITASLTVLRDNAKQPGDKLPVNLYKRKSAAALEDISEKGKIEKNVFSLTAAFNSTIKDRDVTAFILKGQPSAFSSAGAAALTAAKTDAKGEFTVTETLDANLPSGYYTMYIYYDGQYYAGQTEDAKKEYKTPAYYVNSADRSYVFEKLRGNAEDISSVLNDTGKTAVLSALGIDLEKYNSLASEKSNLAGYMADLPATYKQTEEGVIKAYEGAAAFAALKESGAQARYVYDNINILYVGAETEAALAKKTLGGIYNDGRIDDFIIDGLDLQTLPGFRNGFKNALIFGAVNLAKIGDHIRIKEILTDYKTELGIDADIILKNLSDLNKASALSELTGKNFKTADEIRNALTAAAAKYPDAPPKDLNPGGGGKGGGGSVFSGSGTVAEVISQIENAAPKEEQPVFSDVEASHWAYDAVTALYGKGIINGAGNNTFLPGENVKREEFVKMLVLAVGAPDTDAVSDFSDFSDFSDADKNAWYYTYISSAKKAGLINGYDGNIFGIGGNISREEMAAMIYRAAVKYGFNLAPVKPGEDFSDSGDISGYAKEAASVLQTAEIISGTGNGYFNPKGYATRAQSAQILYNLLTRAVAVN
jgi:hypothetical protein